MRLNLGCGNKRKEGFLGVDAFECDAVDVKADLRERLPFEDDSVEEVWMDNVIEHIPDVVPLMAELRRICRDGATITVITPHFASIASWRDPTHVHHFSYFSMDHFGKPGVVHYTGGGFAVEARRLSFGGVLGGIGRMIFGLSPAEYEKNWCFVFRPSTLTFVLRVKKERRNLAECQRATRGN